MNQLRCSLLNRSRSAFISRCNSGFPCLTMSSETTSLIGFSRNPESLLKIVTASLDTRTKTPFPSGAGLSFDRRPKLSVAPANDTFDPLIDNTEGRKLLPSYPISGQNVNQLTIPIFFYFPIDVRVNTVYLILTEGKRLIQFVGAGWMSSQSS